MAPTKRYPYQTVVLLEAEAGEWIERLHDEDGVSRAHALRLALGAGRAVMERAPDSELAELLTEEPYQAGHSRYVYQSVPRLSQDDGAWVDSVHAEKGVDKSTVIRTALRLGIPVVERRRKAMRKIAA